MQFVFYTGEIEPNKYYFFHYRNTFVIIMLQICDLLYITNTTHT